MSRYIPKIIFAAILSAGTVQTAAANATSTIRNLMSDISRSPIVILQPSASVRPLARVPSLDTPAFLRSTLRHSVGRPPPITLGNRAEFAPRRRPVGFVDFHFDHRHFH